MKTQEQEPKQVDIRKEWEWERRRDAETQSYQAVIDFGLAAMRAPALIASGGIIALIGFFSSNSNSIHPNAAEFNLTLKYLMLALLLSAGSTGFAYLTQYSFSMSLRKERYQEEYPYFKTTVTSESWDNTGIFFHTLCIISVLLSYVLLALAGFKFASLVTHMTP